MKRHRQNIVLSIRQLSDSCCICVGVSTLLIARLEKTEKIMGHVILDVTEIFAYPLVTVSEELCSRARRLLLGGFPALSRIDFSQVIGCSAVIPNCSAFS